MRLKDKFRGSLIGGAAGDALGYPVEFLTESEIFEKYGNNGITEFNLRNGVAEISDDTQMTLFTANGLLIGTTKAAVSGQKRQLLTCISHCYKDWYTTQSKKFPVQCQKYSWLLDVPELFSQRAPGTSCISAILKGANGTIKKPINNSKGCGGIMRIAPIGLYFNDRGLDIYTIDKFAAEVAALTHGHELGYIPAAALVHIIHNISEQPEISLLSAVQDSMLAVEKIFPTAEHLHELKALVQKAIALASSNDIDDLGAIHQLGAGWVAEETLAIAVYCSLKYQDNFDKALITAVNHTGDSDSTGAVTGNILGAYIGYERIPEKYKKNLELHDLIIEIADDLYNDCKSISDEKWISKYSR